MRRVGIGLGLAAGLAGYFKKAAEAVTGWRPPAPPVAVPAVRFTGDMVNSAGHSLKCGNHRERENRRDTNKRHRRV